MICLIRIVDSDPPVELFIRCRRYIPRGTILPQGRKMAVLDRAVLNSSGVQVRAGGRGARRGKAGKDSGQQIDGNPTATHRVCSLRLPRQRSALRPLPACGSRRAATSPQ